jgi:hypothetical protein
MRRTITGAAALALSLVVATSAWAGGPKGVPVGGSAYPRLTNFHPNTYLTQTNIYLTQKTIVPVQKTVYPIQTNFYPIQKTIYPVPTTVYPIQTNYALTHGIQFSQGILYAGKLQTHWTSSCWSPRYGCVIYFDPFCNCWYYWCQPFGCYYPVTYCPTGIYAY